MFWKSNKIKLTCKEKQLVWCWNFSPLRQSTRSYIAWIIEYQISVVLWMYEEIVIRVDQRQELRTKLSRSKWLHVLFVAYNEVGSKLRTSGRWIWMLESKLIQLRSQSKFTREKIHKITIREIRFLWFLTRAHDTFSLISIINSFSTRLLNW